MDGPTTKTANSYAGTYSGVMVSTDGNDKFDLQATFIPSAVEGELKTSFTLDNESAPFECGQLSGINLHCIWASYTAEGLVYVVTLDGQFIGDQYNGPYLVDVSDGEVRERFSGAFTTTRIRQ